jgi:exodeoxyribonuclease VII small subunit
MSGHQKLSQSIDTLVEVLEAMKSEELTLDQTMIEFTKAIESYRHCQDYLSSATLDVKEVKVDASQFVEANFDWKEM